MICKWNFLIWLNNKCNILELVIPQQMKKYNHFSQKVSVFSERVLPESGFFVGYAALIAEHNLPVPLPDVLSMISEKQKRYKTVHWNIFGYTYTPEDTLLGHLTFALKYEGIDLLVLNRLFQKLDSDQIHQVVIREPSGQYSRRIWFLYEWLIARPLDIPDLLQGNYIDLVDEKLQYGSQREVERSQRHRVRNNLPGVKEFCPMIRRTTQLDHYINQNFSQKIRGILNRIHPDILVRASAFLLLKDSKASYAIEGEQPVTSRLQRWGRIIREAGNLSISRQELTRLQEIAIENSRFTKLGYRQQEGFIGEHDRRTGTPLPDHISARWQNVESLMDGLVKTAEKLENDENFDAVLATAIIAFGFVFIHPFVDGNGRLHRYLFHHVLLRKKYVPYGMIFPISGIILEQLGEYRITLESFSRPRMPLIDWIPADDHNVEVKNETVDLYRYFDATKQAEFLYSCIQKAIDVTIPEEVDYLEKYDRFKAFIDDYVPMPDRTLSLLVRFLDQGAGKLSERALKREFSLLTPVEVEEIELKYQEIFNK